MAPNPNKTAKTRFAFPRVAFALGDEDISFSLLRRKTSDKGKLPWTYCKGAQLRML
jgi:hypothetical protein